MKLSQKLLALGGVTLADYACCPYDDYGMPHSLCTTALPEKTPFSLEDDWRNGACKAWESNVDATYDGNDNSCETNENWGSCGFQRHFPWNQIDVTNFRNRGCVLTRTGATVTDESGSCQCKGLGDAEDTSASGAAAANIIRCKSTTLVAGTAATDSCTTAYDGTNNDHLNGDGQYMIDNSICCDPAAAVGDTNGNGVDLSCFMACGTDEATHMAGKADCIANDFLGRRNIQSKSLYIDSTTTNNEYATGAELEFSFNSDATGTTGPAPATQNAKLYNLAGVPFLGGVCKLFVPVPATKIVSVQIAGVHVNLNDKSVFPAKVDDAGTPGYTTGEDVGTAYCFSVVNPAEGMRNSLNGIHNGNVAGPAVNDANTNFQDLVMSGTSLERQAGIEPNINFFDGTDASHIGTQLEDSAGSAAGDSEVGANFDVVVHIHSEWCNSPSFWNYADMQLTGDYNNGNNDYPLNNPAGDQAARTDTAYSASQVGPLQYQALLDALATATAGGNAAAIAAAQAAVDAAESNGFTHAHMDLMDKRNNFVASFNNVYQVDPDQDGYLRYPHSDDDAFMDNAGAADAISYAAYASGQQFLRWPNAGSFAAFYSFVACANPPHISNPTGAADVNPYSIIYNKGGTLTTTIPASEGVAYSHLGDTILRSRTLVMSQSDSDYRDEKCDLRTFRGNLRQVGNDVTVCGPGQLPDTDQKRCTWNWNYNGHSFAGTDVDGNGDTQNWTAPNAQNPSDAEEWFDRNDPHSFDMWSTRKRRNTETTNDRKYAFNAGYWGAQEGKTGDTGEMFNGLIPFNAEDADHFAAIQIPIEDYNFNLVFKTYGNGSPAEPTFTTNAANCFHADVDNCGCRPHYSQLTGFETSADTAITFDENYDAETGGFDFDANFADVNHSSCTGTANTNGVAACNPTEIAALRSNLDRAQLTQACDGFLANGTGGYFQNTNRQTLVFDDPRVKTALHPTSKEWEVSVQCDQRSQIAAASYDSNIAQRDFFPDCFFGDELWFTLTYSSASSNGNNAMFQYNSYVSAWYSEIIYTAQEYIST